MKRQARKGPSVSDKLESARANRYKVIHERNLLILALAKHAGFDIHLVRVDDKKLSEPDAWDKVVCLHTPAKQLHWKLSPEDQQDFKSLKTLRKTDYDGAKAAEKGVRLERLHTLPRSADLPAALACEWGFRAAEKGWNLDRTLEEFGKMLKGTQATNAVDPSAQP